MSNTSFAAPVSPAATASASTHPSLSRPAVPGRTGGFAAALTSGPVRVAAQAMGPVGGAVVAGVGAAVGGGSGSELSGVWEMQRQNQLYNAEFLALQESIQAENRRYTTLSNLMKAQHDTAKAAINNIHV